MKNVIRAITLILSIVFCWMALYGCKQDKDDSQMMEGTISSLNSEDAITDREKRALEKDNLPEWVNTKFRGRTISTYSYQENFELDTNGFGELTGDVVHELVFRRNKIVEDRLGIVLDNQVSDTTHFMDYARELGVFSGSGSDDYLIIYTMGNSAIYSGVENYFFSDTSQYEYLSLDSPWWNLDAMKAQSFDGKHLKYLIGDITITTYTKAGAIFVNANEYVKYYSDGMDGLYDIVINGKWTIDMLATKAKECYMDVNANGYDINVGDGDFVGFAIGNPVRVKALEYGFDVKRWSRDKDGFVIVDYDLERGALAVDKLIELLFENPGVYYQHSNYLYAATFATGNVLFYENQLGTLMHPKISSMTEDYGILPTPKLDENQKEYMTEIQESSTFVVIPTTCKDTEFASVVIEALCAESYRNVILPFIEDALKIRYVRESRAGQNIDIILNSATKDYFGLYNPGGIGKLISTTAIMESNRISSNYVTMKTVADEELRQLKLKFYTPQDTE